MTLVGVPASADVPPHGPFFCGSPSRFSTSQDAGAIKVKCASTMDGASSTAANRPRAKRVECRMKAPHGACRWNERKLTHYGPADGPPGELRLRNAGCKGYDRLRRAKEISMTLRDKYD